MNYPNSKLNSALSLRGFTLIELLTVIAIISVLAAILIPAIQGVRERSFVTKTTSNLRHLQQANLLYASDNNGFFVDPVPVARDASGNPTGRDWNSVWFDNDRFIQYLSLDERTTDWEEGFPEIARSGIPELTFGDNQRYSIGMNIGDRQQWGGSIIAFRQSEITNPSQSFAFSDATDFWVKINRADAWESDEEKTGMGMAYRNDGKAAVVHFDGSVSMVTKEESVGNRELWIPDLDN
mgnify:CR=1 FL=1